MPFRFSEVSLVEVCTKGNIWSSSPITWWVYWVDVPQRTPRSPEPMKLTLTMKKWFPCAVHPRVHQGFNIPESERGFRDLNRPFPFALFVPKAVSYGLELIRWGSTKFSLYFSVWLFLHNRLEHWNKRLCLVSWRHDQTTGLLFIWKALEWWEGEHLCIYVWRWETS